MKEVLKCSIKIKYTIFLTSNKYRLNCSKCNSSIIVSKCGKCPIAEIDAQYQQLAFAECCAVLGKHMQRQMWIGYTVCNQLWQRSFALKSCDVSQLLAKFHLGYNLGTPALKPYKWEIKPYQNNAVLQEKAMKNRTCNEQEKEFEWWNWI